MAREFMLVGASHAVEAGNDPDPLEDMMGLTDDQRLDLFRYYDSGGPASAWNRTQVGGKGHVGKRPLWWSCKGDINDWQNPNGTNVKNAVALAKSYDPTWPRIWWTVYHEVQPKLVTKTFTFEQFKRMQENFYNAVKPVAPKNMKICFIHGGFGWRPNSVETTQHGTYSATPEEWRTIPTDVQAIDNYGGPQVEDIIEMDRFQRFVNEMAGGDLNKVGIAESGMRQSSLLKKAGGDEAKANQLGIDWVHRQGEQLGNGGLWAWCVWNSTKTVDPGPMTPDQAHAFGDVWRDWSPKRP